MQTDCLGAPCWCEHFGELWAQAASNSNFVEGYKGTGAHPVTLIFPGMGLIHVWPQGPCGDILAASGLCWCDGGNFRETEIVRRTFHQWGPMATFNLVPGHAYWARQDTLIAPIPATIDTLRVGT